MTNSALPPDTEFKRWTCANCDWRIVMPETKDGSLYCLICGPSHQMSKEPATREEYETQLVVIVPKGEE